MAALIEKDVWRSTTTVTGEQSVTTALIISQQKSHATTLALGKDSMHQPLLLTWQFTTASSAVEMYKTTKLCMRVVDASVVDVGLMDISGVVSDIHNSSHSIVGSPVVRLDGYRKKAFKV